MVKSSLQHSLSDNNTDFATAFSPWASTIRQFSIDGSSETISPQLHSDRSRFISFARGSAALAILALFTSAAVLTCALASLHLRLRGRPALWVLYLATFFDGLLFLAATALAMNAMNYGPRSIVRYAGLQPKTGEFLGPGMYTLVAGVVIKFLAIAGFFFGFLFFGLISIIVAIWPVLCACACLCGPGQGPGQDRYRCSNCGWTGNHQSGDGYCPNC
jgi:hypothetical protein